MLCDVNTSLGRWPFARFDQANAADLAAHLAAEGIGWALVSAIESVLFPDPHLPNADLAAAVAPHPSLVPLMTVDPTLGHWRRCLDGYRAAGCINAVRLVPNYHRYALDAPGVDDLAAALRTASHPVLVVQMRVDDERSQYPLMQVPGVPVDGVIDLARRHPDLPILCLCTYRAEAIRLGRETPNVFVDTAFIEYLDTLASLLAHVPPERVLFGSHTPFLYTRANVLKLREASVGAAALEAVGARNAARLFGLDHLPSGSKVT